MVNLYITSVNFFIIYPYYLLEAYELEEGKYECNHWKIAKRYLKGFLVLDVVATFPLEIIIKHFFGAQLSGVNQASKLTKLPKLIKILKITRLLKLLRVYRLQKIMKQLQLNYNIHQGISRLFHIVLVILFATHFVGCFWHGIGVELDISQATTECSYNIENEPIDQDNLDQGWVCREGMANHALYHKYIASIYWAFSTLTTVGYGDIFARTVSEQAFSMVMMLLGVSWYAYVVGSISTVLASFDRQNKMVREKLLQVNSFIRETKLPHDLGQRVRQYYEYSLSKRRNGLFTYDADEILQELSAALRTDVITHVEADLISRIPFFRGKSSLFVANTVQALQPVVVPEGDFIIKEGSAADEMFFLIKGSAAVFYGQKRVNTLTEGSYFGEIGCILGGIRRAGIIAETACELQCLSKRNLNILLGQHPEVGEDLKAVARARMKQVKRTSSSMIYNAPGQKSEDMSMNIKDGPSEKSKAISSKHSNGQNHVENNLRKLEQMDFKSIEETSEAFSDLRSDVEGMARRLSLTSGVLMSGSHIKADQQTIDRMNSDSTQKIVDHENNDSDSDSSINGIQSDKSFSSNHDIQAPIEIEKKSIDELLSSLSEADENLLSEFLIRTIQNEVEERFIHFAKKLRSHNLAVLGRIIDEHDF